MYYTIIDLQQFRNLYNNINNLNIDNSLKDNINTLFNNFIENSYEKNGICDQSTFLKIKNIINHDENNYETINHKTKEDSIVNN